MNRIEAKDEIKLNWRQILRSWTGQAKDPVNGEESYICPLCKHGSGGDGITYNPQSKDPGGLHCFGCGFSGDIIDLYQQARGVDFSTALDDLARDLNIDIDPLPQKAKEGRPLVWDDVIGLAEDVKPSREPAKDFTGYYMACMERLTDPAALAYLEGRGISYETAFNAGIGFDPAADPAAAPGAIGEDESKQHPAPRIIIPNGPNQYVGRSIDPDTEKKYQKINSKGGKAGLFNLPALYTADAAEIFVTEGGFDALSFLEVGVPAIALNSTSNADLLIKELEKQRIEGTLILCLDDDKAGKEAAEKLKTGLDRLNVSYIYPAPSEYLPAGCKDANEALTASRSNFISAVDRLRQQNAARPDNVSDYITRFMLDDMDSFREEKKTGFPLLDYKAGGGLYPGLYVLAAISSLGKTTFSQQLADQLAERGNDVIFFSLEQSRLEMVSKSLARRIKQKNKNSTITALQIRKGLYMDEVSKAIDSYTAAVGERISIVEGNFNCDVSYIGNYIRRYIRRNKARPVVLIDYLQILQPGEADRRQSMREAIDSTVTELKRLSREMDITVIVISSVNRANYLTPFDFESLKESGGIEYTADVVMGLQLQCLNEDLFNSQTKIKEKRARVKQAKAETPRKIELICLKNRYGRSSFSCYFDYFPENDLFVETTGELEAEGWGNEEGSWEEEFQRRKRATKANRER